MSEGAVEESLTPVPESARAAVRDVQDRARLNEIRRRPEFPEQARRAVVGWRIAPGDDDAVLAAHLRDLGRFLCGVWAIYLHGTPGGLTRGRLTALLKRTVVSGPDRAPSLLIFMRFIRYIEPIPHHGDRREARYAPTERLTAAIAKRYRGDMVSSLWLEPAGGRLLDRYDDPVVQAGFAMRMIEQTLAFFEVFRETGPSLDTFSQRYGGMVLLSELLDLGAPGDRYPPEGSLKFSVAGLARRCGISRTQVRRLIREGEAAGFFEILGEGELRATPLLAEHVEMLTAAHMLSIAHAIRRTIADLAAEDVDLS